MIKNKKAIATNVMYGIMLLVIIFIIVIIALVKPFGIGAKELGGKINTLSDSACLAQGQAMNAQGISFQDLDNDLRPDLKCDICISKTGKNTQNNIDKDADGVPDGCDMDPNNASIGFCDSKPGMTGCSENKNCGPNSNPQGTIKNIGTKKDPILQCAMP